MILDIRLLEDRARQAERFNAAQRLRAVAGDLEADISWEKADKPCSGPGYAHKAHGKCPGYTTDRT